MASSPSDDAPVPVDTPAATDPDPEVRAIPGANDGAEAARRVPTQEELERIAVDVHIRRRPRYGVFIVLGMLLAGGAALVWTTSVPQQQHENWGATVWVTTIGAAALGVLLGAGAAVLADWLSRRK